MLHEVEIAAELQHRMLADRMVGGEEGTEVQAWHERISRLVMMSDSSDPDRTAAEPAVSGPPTLPSLENLGNQCAGRRSNLA
jgi:hypothetical protein